MVVGVWEYCLCTVCTEVYWSVLPWSGRGTAGIPWYVPREEGISGISCAVGAVIERQPSSRGTVHVALLCGVPAAWYRYQTSSSRVPNTSHGTNVYSHRARAGEIRVLPQKVLYKENAPPPPPYRANHGHPTN